MLGDAQDQREDIHHRLVDPAEDDAVDRDAEIEGAEASQECGRFAGIADLREFDIGHDAGAPPQARVEEHGQHAAGDHAPPQPIPGDAAYGDHSGDRERRVGGEGCGHHGGPGEPPRDIAAREEKFVDARFGARTVV